MSGYFANTALIGATADDVNRVIVYGDSGSGFRSWNPASPTVFSPFASSPGGYYCASAIDPTRGTNGAGVFFLLGLANSAQPSTQYAATLDLGNPSAGWTTRNLGLTFVDLSGESKGPGMVYAPALDAFIFVNRRGNTLHRIDASTYTASAIATTGDAMPDNENNAQVDVGGKGGMYNRCGWSQALGGFFWVPSVMQGPYFVRLV